LAGGHREELRERIKGRLLARQTAEVEGLREKIAHLTAEIDQGTKRLMRVPEELFTALSGELAGGLNHTLWSVQWTHLIVGGAC
jgi:hypothetical protein